jgi:hypothetical protein
MEQRGHRYGLVHENFMVKAAAAQFRGGPPPIA